MSFSVVEFRDDESVDVVPSSWLADDVCWWPPFRSSRLTNAKKKREVPDETTWMKNKARILGSYDTYAEARARLLRATETSTLETDDEESAAKSRMKRKKTFSDVEADDEFEGRPPPKLSKVTKKCAATISAEAPVPRGLHYGDHDAHSLTNPAERRSPRKSPRKNMNPHSLVSQAERHSPRKSPNCTPLSNTDSTPLASGSHSQMSGTAQPAAGSKLVLLKLTRLEQQQQYQTQLLQKILDVLQASDGDAGEVPEGVTLPVKTVAAMKELERKLQDEEIYRKLVRHLGSIGGKDVSETTRRVLRAILDNSVAIHMNFAGRGGKHGIENMKLMCLVVAAARRNKLVAKATRSEVENTVKLWLRYAADRGGGRHVRRAPRRLASNRDGTDTDASD